MSGFRQAEGMRASLQAELRPDNTSSQERLPPSGRVPTRRVSAVAIDLALVLTTAVVVLSFLGKPNLRLILSLGLIAISLAILGVCVLPRPVGRGRGQRAEGPRPWGSQGAALLWATGW